MNKEINDMDLLLVVYMFGMSMIVSGSMGCFFGSFMSFVAQPPEEIKNHCHCYHAEKAEMENE